MKPGFYTAHMFGRDNVKLKLLSVRFRDRHEADNWAAFLNISDPKHFVIQVPYPTEE